MSSLSEELAVFSLAGPKAAETMAMAKCAPCPEPGRSVEWEFEGEKVNEHTSKRGPFETRRRRKQHTCVRVLQA